MDFGSVSQAKRPLKSRQDELELFDEAERLTTPQYRAPELFDRGVAESVNIDEKIDIWVRLNNMFDSIESFLLQVDIRRLVVSYMQ